MSRSNSALSLELSGEASGAGAGAGSGAFATPRTSHAVDAYARRAAWSLLSALPRVTPTETFATAYGVVGGAGTLAFVWRAVESSRVGASRPVVDAVVASLREETTAAEAFAGEDAACRAAMTCAAADALSRATAASASSESSSSSRKSAEASGEPAWATLATLAEALAAATRRWTERAGREALAGGGARGVFDARRRRTPRQVRPALRKIRSGLATDVADVVHGDGSWAFRREEALGKSVDAASITAAVPAYLRVAGDGDAAGALFACQLALDRALVAARDAARADASVSECAAAAAAATARLDVIAAHPSTEFAWSAASKAASNSTSPRCFVGRKKTNRRRTRRRDGDTSRRGRPEAVDAVLESAASFASEARDRDAAALLDAAAAPLSRGEPSLSSRGKNFPRRDASSLGENGPAPAARRGGYRAMEREERDGPRDETNSSERRGRGRGRRKAFGGRSRTRVGVGFGVLGGLDASRARLGRRDGGVFGDGADGFFAGPVGRRQRCRRGSPSRADGGERGSIVGGVARARDASRGDASTDTRGVLRSGTVRVVAMRANPASTRAHARRDGRARAAETFAELVDTAAALAASEPAALASLRAQLRTLAAILAPEAISRRRPATVPSLPSVPVGVDVRFGVHPPAFAHARVRDGRVDVVVVVRVR